MILNNSIHSHFQAEQNLHDHFSKQKPEQGNSYEY